LRFELTLLSCAALKLGGEIMTVLKAIISTGFLFLTFSLQIVPLHAEDVQTKTSPGPAGAPLPSNASKPRASADDTSGLQSQALLGAIDKILKRAASEREAAKTMPPREKFLFEPVWTETREEREKSIRSLLDSALAIVTDAPVLKLQDDIQKHRDKIADDRERIASLRERRLQAPPSSAWPSVFVETQASIDQSIESLSADMKRRDADIARIKVEINKALAAAGVMLSQEQTDLLLDGVLGADMLKLMTAFEVAKIADERLGVLVTQSNEDLKAARRYFAMHAALFALLVHAQDLLIDRIDYGYLVRLEAIAANIEKTAETTRELLESHQRDDQRKALESNLKAQDISRKVSSFYRDYLRNQRRLLAQAREKTLFDLKVADNTYETVEESFQLKALMDEARSSFETLQRLDQPGFEQIFRNENLRREFENLTQKLGPSS
jgi:hypothetical protein